MMTQSNQTKATTQPVDQGQRSFFNLNAGLKLTASTKFRGSAGGRGSARAARTSTLSHGTGADGAFPSQAVRTSTLSHGMGADGAFPSQVMRSEARNQQAGAGLKLPASTKVGGSAGGRGSARAARTSTLSHGTGADGAFPSRAARTNTLNHGMGADGAFPSQVMRSEARNQQTGAGLKLPASTKVRGSAGGRGSARAARNNTLSHGMGADGAFPSQAARNSTLSHGMGADGAFPSRAARTNTLSHGTGADGAFPSRASDPAYKNDAGKSGFTLIELLVVISIMAALTALMLPRLRTVNQDRGIREAARVVGSKFAEASDRARRDGAAAVTLFRNPNMVDVNGVQFGVSTISISRAVPNFIGDDDTLATVTSTFGGGRALLIPLPLEYDQSTPEENVVRAGDFVRFNQAGSPPMPVTVTSSVAYQITNVSPLPSGGSLQLVLDRKPTQPPLPSAGTSVSYVIERQPKLLRSSITDLPPGYTVDLRLSGPVVPMEDGSGEVSVLSTHEVRPVFFEVMRPGLEADQTSTAERARLAAQYSRIDVLFDSTGGVSSVRTYRGNWNNTASLGLDSPQPITGPLALFVMPSEVEQRTDARPLYDETNLWVTISNTSGGVNIGYNNPPLAAGGTTLGELVTEARRTASTGQSASQ